MMAFFGRPSAPIPQGYNNVPPSRVSNPTSAVNPFAGSTPDYRGGFVRTVFMGCSCCGSEKKVSTEDFRLKYMCEDCKSLPVLLRVIGKYTNRVGI